MNFKEYLDSRRTFLHSYLKDFISREERLSHDALSDVALERLASFVVKGKMFRGVLVMLGYEMYSDIPESAYSGAEYPNQNVLNVAAAMELSQSALLIHDDIMDNDLTRRGDKTIYAQYIEDAQAQNIPLPDQYGKSMGMVVGDASFFLTYELIGNVDAPAPIRSLIMNKYSKEMLKVTLGQFLDYHYGQTELERTKEEITRMYHLKTVGYTSTLPCILGAYLAGKLDADLTDLESITEHLGTLFQIKDDELGLFGDPKVTGKPLGSDISENKKTLFRAELFEVVTQAEQKKLHQIFGKELTDANISYVQNLIERYDIRQIMQARAEERMKEARTLVEKLPISAFYKSIFENIIEYNASRGS